MAPGHRSVTQLPSLGNAGATAGIMDLGSGMMAAGTGNQQSRMELIQSSELAGASVLDSVAVGTTRLETFKVKRAECREETVGVRMCEV